MPKPLKDVPALKDVPFSIVKNNPDRYKNVSLLWGGRIVNCSNTKEGTTIEVLHLPLDREGYPQETDASEGRFIVLSKNFLDCAIYTRPRALTVAGRFIGLKEGKIDEMPYSFPVIEADVTYLWKPRIKGNYPYWRPSIWLWYGSPGWWIEYGPYDRW